MKKMTKPIFKNKNWKVTWCNDRKTEICVEKITFPLPSFGCASYAIMYPDGRIAYDFPEIPQYLKEKVKSAFLKNLPKRRR
ncbi:MAG: hypothetical protein WC372_12625 [Candidatus Neomarinimicrobiota bacterium]|jgi:hypothetical protein